jgi:polysaccharide pyruvyl transferase WcaK-like protein
MSNNDLTAEEKRYIIAFCNRCIASDKMMIDDDIADRVANRDDVNYLEPETLVDIGKDIDTCEGIIKKLRG